MVLTRERYKELLDEIARLKTQLKPDKPVPPSRKAAGSGTLAAVAATVTCI